MTRENEKETVPGMLGPDRRIVVKVGSSLLVTGGRLRQGWLSALARDMVAAMRGRGCALLLVSSGAEHLTSYTYRVRGTGHVRG